MRKRRHTPDHPSHHWAGSFCISNLCDLSECPSVLHGVAKAVGMGKDERLGSNFLDARIWQNSGAPISSRCEILVHAKCFLAASIQILD